MTTGKRSVFYRTVALGIAVAAISALSIGVVWRTRVWPQTTAIAALAEAGGICLYDFEYDFDPRNGRIAGFERRPMPSPFLQVMLGRDWYAAPVYVQFSDERLDDRDLADACTLVMNLPTVRHVALGSSRVSDKSLPSLHRLRQLSVLDVRRSAISPDGVDDLKRSLPECQVLSGPDQLQAGSIDDGETRTVE